MQRRSLVEFFEGFAWRGDEIAVAHRRGYRMARWSYLGIARAARQFARELEARGIGRGDRVLLWGENSAEWIIAFRGCVLRGVVVVPMDRIAVPDSVRRVAEQVDAKLIICSGGTAGLGPSWPTLRLEGLSEGVAQHSSEPYPSPELARGDPAEIVFTSGTTAEPRGVVLSHGNLLANIEPLETEIQKYLRYERFVHPLRFLVLLPLSHVFGQLMGFLIPPLLGGTVIFLDTLSPAEIARAIKRERVSVLVAVPRLIESLRDKVERDLEAAGRLDDFHRDFRAAEGKHFLRRWWRFRRIHRQFGWKFWALISGGAALPAEAEAFWSRLGYAVIQGYGLTETTSLVSVNHPFQLGKGSIGKAVPGMEVKLDANGEILVRGENVAAGYWQGRKIEPMAGEGRWFHTGDLGQLDEKGNLYFKGRRKNVIVTPAGMNVYPEDLEAALRAQPGVRDCVVIGLKRDGNAEPCAVLLLRDATADAEAIVRRANESLAEYQQMRHWSVWREQDFPRTRTQKPVLHRIEEVAQAELVTPAGAHALSSPLGELIARVTHSGAQISPETDLATGLNLSSLDRVDLLSALEERYQVDLNEAGFAEAKTVGELERLLGQTPSRPAELVYPRWAQRWSITWIRCAIYYLLVWTATRLLAWPRIHGREHLREVRGPILVIANHITMTDVGFVLAALPLRLRHRLAVAMEAEILEPMRRPPPEMGFLRRALERTKYFLIVALFNVFPLPQRSGFRESFAFAGDLVDRGWSVLVFPEGQRTRDGRLAPFRPGIGLLATRLGLPIVPMRIDGLFELKMKGAKVARPGQIRVAVGAPVRFGPDADPMEIARELEGRVASL